MARSSKTICLIFLLIGFFLFFNGLREQRKIVFSTDVTGYTLPSSLSGPLALEFKGLASDMLLFKFMVFMGGHAHDYNEFQDEQWDFVNKTLWTVTDLDPYYWDAYNFAQMFLALTANRAEEANDHLVKANDHLPDEWRIPFYIGFNYYQFIKDNKKAAHYFMEASRKPGSRHYLPILAARITVLTFEHELGILFLEEMLEGVSDKKQRAPLEKRLTSLKNLLYLERKIDEYHSKFGKYPLELAEVIDDGLLTEVPTDPYGGEYLILNNGRVYSTSRLIDQDYITNQVIPLRQKRLGQNK